MQPRPDRGFDGINAWESRRRRVRFAIPAVKIACMDGDVRMERATIPSSLITPRYGSRIGSRGMIGPFCSVWTNPNRQYALRCPRSRRAAFRLLPRLPQ